MTDAQIDAWREDVWDFVFHLLDAEPDWTGDDAGKVASAAAQAVEAAIRGLEVASV